MTRTLSSVRSVKRVSAIGSLILALFCIQGCADYQVRMPDSDPINEQYQSATMNAYVWGAWYDPQVLMARCESRALNDVVLRRNYLHDLAGVFTFGLWMPTKFEYRCKAPAADVGGFPEAPPAHPATHPHQSGSSKEIWLWRSERCRGFWVNRHKSFKQSIEGQHDFRVIPPTDSPAARLQAYNDVTTELQDDHRASREEVS